MRHAEIWESLRLLRQLQSKAPPLRPRTERGPAPLSFSQQRLWLLHQFNPGGPEFNVPYAFRVFGDLNSTALSQAMSEIRRRHEPLRTTYGEIQGKAVQTVHETTLDSISLVDLSQYAPDEKDRRITLLIDEAAKRPFDLSCGPVLKVQLLRLEQREHVLLVTFHHIAFDAWSDGVFFKELDALYAAYSNGLNSPLRDLDIQYTDYAFWQREWRQSEAFSDLLEYWKENLANIPAQIFPTDFPRPTAVDGILGRSSVVLEKRLCDDLKALAAGEGLSDFIVLLAAFKVLLHSYLEQDDLYVCAPIANRSRNEVQKLIGYFVNFVIYRTDLATSRSFRDLLRNVCTVSSGAYAHQEMPIQELIDRLGLYHLPLSQIVFSVQNARRHEPRLDGLSVVALNERRGVDFDVFLEIEESRGSMELNLRYNARLFRSSTMEDLINDYVSILEAVAENPDQALSSLSPLGDVRKSEWRRKRAEQTKLKGRSEATAGGHVAPRDELETQLTRIWENLLGRSPVGVTDNFFELGGKSLVAIQMVAQIQESIGRGLPVSILAQAQTIEQIADFLRRDQVSSSTGAIIALQPMGSGPPLFLLQPAASTALHFGDLARHLAPDQPVYGFEQRGMDGAAPPHQSVEEMAAFYVHEMKAVAPEGPYLLMGRCMGGVVAFEMALQLQAQQETVAFLGILDTQSPPRMEGRGIRYYMVEAVSRVMTYIKSGTLMRATIGRFLKKARRRKSRDSTDRITQLVMDTHAHARRHYVPARQYDGVLKIFRNSESSLSAQQGWAKLATQGVDVHESAGSHGTMLEPENIRAFVGALRSALKHSLDPRH